MYSMVHRQTVGGGGSVRDACDVEFGEACFLTTLSGTTVANIDVDRLGPFTAMMGLGLDICLLP
jgi:hypothetical protein